MRSAFMPTFMTPKRLRGGAKCPPELGLPHARLVPNTTSIPNQPRPAQFAPGTWEGQALRILFA